VDTDGELIVEGAAYRVHVLTVPGSGDISAAALDAAPAPITLRRTHLVKTLAAVIQAGSGGMDVDAQGRIYHADFGATLDGPPGTRIHRITPDGTVSVWAEGFTGASGNAFDSNGNFFQSSIAGNRISRVTPDGQVSTFATNGIDGPVGVAIDADDNLYVANCIGQHDPQGTAGRYDRAVRLIFVVQLSERHHARVRRQLLRRQLLERRCAAHCT
jgi:sugar lactone lactonase YvrE